MYDSFSRETAQSLTGTDNPDHESGIVFTKDVGETWKEYCKERQSYFGGGLWGLYERQKKFRDAHLNMTLEMRPLRAIEETLKCFVDETRMFAAKSVLNMPDDVCKEICERTYEEMKVILSENVLNALGNSDGDVEVTVKASASHELMNGVLCEVRDNGAGPDVQEWLGDAASVCEKAAILRPKKLDSWTIKQFKIPLIRHWFHPGRRKSGSVRGSGKINMLRAALTRCAHHVDSGGCSALAMSGMSEMELYRKATLNPTMRGALADSFQQLKDLRSSQGNSSENV